MTCLHVSKLKTPERQCTARRPFVCLSQVGILSKQLSRHCVGRNLGISKNRGTSLWNYFVQNSVGLLWNIFRQARRSTVASAVNVDRRPSPVYHAERPLQCTTRWAGSPATTETCRIHCNPEAAHKYSKLQLIPMNPCDAVASNRPPCCTQRWTLSRWLSSVECWQHLATSTVVARCQHRPTTVGFWAYVHNECIASTVVYRHECGQQRLDYNWWALLTTLNDDRHAVAKFFQV